MKQRVFLSGLCILLIVLILVPAALAATVTCPSSCSCLLPADAKKLGSSGYCGGKQQVCGFDTLKNEKYCYEKPVTTVVPQLLITAKPFVTTIPTTIPPQKCASGCTCLSTADGKARGLQYCGGKQTLCGYAADKTPLYCFSPAAGTTQTTLPVLQVTRITVTPATTTGTCPAGCTCLSTDKADALGLSRCSVSSEPCGSDPLGRSMYCYILNLTTKTIPVTLVSTITPSPSGIVVVPINEPVTTGIPAAAPSVNIITIITGFFASLFGSFPASSTSSGMTSCSGTLTDTMTDNLNCGSCGMICSGQCVGGSCRNTGPGARIECLPYEVKCNGNCTALNIDRENCGNCGNVCPGNLDCTGGTCQCAEGKTLCHPGGDSVCRDLNNDRSNCGSCGNICPSTLVCSGGTCQCAEGATSCPSDSGGSFCRDLNRDRFNCGGCDHICGWYALCSGGTCQCAEGESLCPWHPGDTDMAYSVWKCANLTNNPRWCGSCDTRCPPNSACINGTCVGSAIPPAGMSRCSVTISDGTFETTYWNYYDLMNDNYNCGRCSNLCPIGQRCLDRYCVLV